MSGTLYLCATPIGNLEDITLRVLRTLQEVDVIAAEDTRNTIKLLNHFEIKTPMTSYHEYNKVDKAAYLVEQLANGKNIALVTDAGTPAISDPGEELVKQAYAAGIPVTSLPGACACVTALTLSGLSTRRFAFEAFLPSDKKLRRKILDSLCTETRTVIIYEAPHKLETTLKDLQKVLTQDRKVTLAREITKIHEEFIRGNIDEIIQKAENLKGEIVLIIEGNKEVEEENSLNNLTIEEHYKFYEKQGLSKKDIIKKIAKDRNMNKNDVYQQFI